MELPIAYVNATIANSNRDPKRKKDPFSPLDFVFYGNPKDGSRPDAAPAAAYMELVDRNLLPSWALFCFKDMKGRAVGVSAPPLLCFMCEDAILLSPVAYGNIFVGLLIALESASNQKRKMSSPDGREVWLQLPKIDTKMIAKENIELRQV